MSMRAGITRFPDWRTLRSHVAGEARRAPGALLVLTPTTGARHALEQALRSLLLESGRAVAELPEVRTPAQALADLLVRANPPARLVSPLERSLLMEGALIDAGDADGAPCGNLLRLAGPLLRLFDEQARDRPVAPGRPAFEALIDRADRVFDDVRETDRGADRLLRLTGWLARVHRRYLARLAASGRLDLEQARHALLETPPTPAWSVVLVVGDQTTGLADNQVLGAVTPPGNLHFLLLKDDSAPPLPEGWSCEERQEKPDPDDPPRLFAPPAAETAEERSIFRMTDPEKTGEQFLFRMTDRAGETRAATRMLEAYRDEAGAEFPGFERCAVAARTPATYLDTLAASLEGAGIPFQTDVQPSLAEEPWPAGVDDVLAFAERPGRLSNGFALLRSPFFRDDRLGGNPGRLADIAETSLAGEGIPDTHEPEGLDALAERVRQAAASMPTGAAGSGSPGPGKRHARELGIAAEVIARLAAYSGTLAPIREGSTPFREAVTCLIGYVDARMPGAPDDASDALLQAADPSLPDTRVEDASRFRDRIRRQFRRHRTHRHSGRSGVHLIAAEDAPFGDYDCLILLGVGDADWPGPRPGNIFFPTRVLEDATRKRFREARKRETRLLSSFAALPRKVAGFSRAELEDGFPAGASPLSAFLEDRLGARERIALDIPESPPAGDVPSLPRALDRSSPGAVDLTARPLSPTAVVLYSRNPAQFFLERVLHLRREETLTDTGSRTARGKRLHQLMAESVPAFFREYGPITEGNLEDALDFLHDRYRGMPDPWQTDQDRDAEELWLFGGASHPSALEWFLRQEAERGPGEPLRIEEELEGIVEPAADPLPALRVRGIVDRVDRTPDGLRVLELKSGSSAGKDDAFLQARLYGRLAGAPVIGVPFFRDRVWEEPKPGDLGKLDRKITAVRDGLAAGEFPVPADERGIKPFDWPLAIRPDLPEDPPKIFPTGPVLPGAVGKRRRDGEFQPPDKEERRFAADPRRHVVLRASAGTGKTRILTDRYLNLVGAGVPPRNILALTFTRKAAAEMKDRIIKRLSDPKRERPPGADPGDISVSTLDAFNLGLVREFPLDAGIDPGVEVLDEREMPVMQQEAIRRVLHGATDFDRQALAELPLLGRSLARLDAVASAWLQHRTTWRRTFEEREERAERAGTREEPPSLPALRERLLPVQSEARQFLAGYMAPVPLPARLALRLRFQPASRDALDREDLVAWLKPEVRTFPQHVSQHGKSVKQEYLRVKEALRDFDRDWLDALNDRTFPVIWKFLRKVEGEYQALKESRGVMDFDDLTLAATRLLRNTGEFAESRLRLESRYHHLLVDEFQDTSDPQWELLQALVEPWTSGEGLAAEEVRRVTGGRLEAPTLFVVGDHKQSIYRFRNARVEVLGKAENWMQRVFPAASPPRVALRWNFRSTAPLRTFVNDVAQAVAEGDLTDADWRFRYDRDDRFPKEPGPVDEGSAEETPLAISVAEDHEEAARRVAHRIARIAGGGASLDQIAILARRGNELGIYRAALERLGIPSCLVKGAGFFETSEVRDLTALCRFLARPHSDLRAVELLRSRFFATPARSLAALRNADRKAETPFSDVLTSGGNTPSGFPAADAAPLREAGVRVAPWIKLSQELPPSLAVQRILNETGYRARARRSGTDGPFAGAQQAANVEKALQHLRRLEHRGFATLAAAARHLESAGSDGHDTTQAPLRVTGAVQVLTIHAAKGLEYEHVALVDLNGTTRSAGGGLRVQEGDDGRWSVALIHRSSDWEIRDGGRASAEERRCLYVAMTRAKRSLTLSGVTRFTNNGAAYKPRGLASYLPAPLWEAAAATAREHRREIRWPTGIDRCHTLKVLPPSEGP